MAALCVAIYADIYYKSRWQRLNEITLMAAMKKHYDGQNNYRTKVFVIYVCKIS